MNSDVRVKGLSQLNDLLGTLPNRLQASILRVALREGAKVVAQQAKQNLQTHGSVHSGRLLESIRVTTTLKGEQAIAKVLAGGRSGGKTVLPRKGGGLRVGYEQAFYALWVEYGTAAHKILPRRPGGFLSIGGNLVRGVEHPGAKPKPYMRPALEGKAQEAVVAVATYMKKRLSAKRFGLDAKSVEIEAQ